MMQWITLIIMGAVTLIYLIAGGIIFHLIEGPAEENIQKVDINKFIKSFIERNPCINDSDASKLLKLLVDAYEHNIEVIQNDTGPHPKWDLLNSVFFAGSIISTIGYGHLAPQTELGRQMCILYLMWGIPLFLATLFGFGQKMDLHSSNLLKLVAKGREKEHPRMASAMKTLAVFVIGSVLFVILPAALFMVMEDWDYSIGIYYAFITLSTVGFGDYVAGVNPSIEYPIWYRIFGTLWLLLGLCWLSTVIGAKQNTFEEFLDDEIQQIEKRAIKSLENETETRPPDPHQGALNSNHVSENKLDESPKKTSI